MAFFNHRSSQQQRPYIESNGGISRNKRMPEFSFARFAILSILLGWLAATNTENRALLAWIMPNADRFDDTPFETRRTTNYGLFHTKERILKVIIDVAGHEWSCHYDEPIYGEIFCRDVLRNYFCHEMPLFEGDIVYRMHRAVCFLLIASTCLAACFITPLHLDSGKSLISNSIVSLFVSEQLRLAPAPTLIHRLVSWNVFCYPALKALYKTVQYQDTSSIFQFIPENPELNFVCSISVVFIMSVIMNALSTLWDGSFVLQFESISSILMGFHAKYRAAMVMEVFYHDISWNAITWSFLVTLLLQRSFAAAGFWWLGHLSGQTLGQYQVDHYVSALSVKRVMDWLNW